MALTTNVVAGAYTGTYNRAGGGANALNYTRQGFNINYTPKGERVEESDLYGLCLIEIIGRGGQATIDMICKVYSATTVRAMFRWSTAATLGRIYDAAAPLATVANGPTPDVLVLTKVANTPATPTTLTANVIISPDNNMQLVFNSTLRESPLKFDCLLDDSVGTGSLFTVS